MAIEDIDQFETFEGNASTVTAYAIPFAFRASEDLIVTRIDADGERTLLVEGDDYTVNGANLVTTEAIPVDEFLEVERDTPLVQDLDTESPAGSYITAIEGRLDRIVMALQDIAARVLRYFGRTFRVPEGETLEELPDADTRKGKIPYFNATTGALELLTPDEFLSLTTPFFEIAIGTVEHLDAGEAPTATLTGTYPEFVLNLGLPTGATGSIDGGPDCGFGTLPNENGGQDLALYDDTTDELRRVRFDDGVPVALAPVP